jgi:hypothetical protein
MLKTLSLMFGAAILCIALAPAAEAKTRFKVEYLFDSWAPHPDAYFYDEDFSGDEDVVVYDRNPVRQYDEFDENYYEPDYVAPARPTRKLQAEVPRRQVIQPMPQSRKLALANPELQTGARKAKPAEAGVSCSKVTQLVSGYGFSDVKVKSCAGKIFAFTGTRSGKSYEISVSSGSGQLTEVKRI